MRKFHIRKHCLLCHEAYEFEVEDMPYVSWCSGMLIQEAFPNLSADERDAIRGICLSCSRLSFDEDDTGSDREQR